MRTVDETPMPPSLIRLLEPLIGQTLQLNGHHGIVIDVIEDPAALVLQDTNNMPHLHRDYLGRAQEHIIPSWTISLVSDSGHAITPELQRQLTPELGRALHRYLFEPD
jgi:AraC-like DNA-binding protein